MKRMFYAWLFPLLCGTCSYLHHYHPGDENAMYIVSSFPGVWLCFLSLLSTPTKTMRAVYIAVGLAVVMCVVGLVMDLFRIRKVLWLLTFIVCAPTVFVISIMSYPSIERAIDKNGSLWAYILTSFNIGMYLSVFLSAMITIFARGLKLIKQWKIRR